MDDDMMAMMQTMMACTKKSQELHNNLMVNPRARLLNIKLPTTLSRHFAFRVKVLGDVTIEEKKITEISISVPSDAMGNRGPRAPYYEPAIPETIETAPFSDDEILDDEIHRFTSIEKLLDYLEEVVGKKK